MEHFVTDHASLEKGTVLRHYGDQIEGESPRTPSSGALAFVEFPNNERVSGTIRHIEGETWEFETENGERWELVMPILDGKMRAREFTVVKAMGEN